MEIEGAFYLGFSKGEELGWRNIAIGAFEILVSRR